MTQDLAAAWDKAGLPANEPDDLARAIAALAAADRTIAPAMLQREADLEGAAAVDIRNLRNSGSMDWDQVEKTDGLTGRAFYVAGGLCWDIEEGLDRTRDLWLGKTPNDGAIGTQTLLRKVGFRKRN